MIIAFGEYHDINVSFSGITASKEKQEHHCIDQHKHITIAKFQLSAASSFSVKNLPVRALFGKFALFVVSMTTPRPFP